LNPIRLIQLLSVPASCRGFLRRALITATALLSAALVGQAAEPPVNIIFDTDVDHDCDDIGALFILHGAVERGEAKLLATIGCTSTDGIAPTLDAINTWFGRPEIPVGTLKDSDFIDHRGFAAELLRRYPKTFASGKDYPDAVKVYRKVLAEQLDGSVVVLAVGPLRNLANLLKSLPDDLSPLDGQALIAKKVKRLDIMGGNYPPSNAKEAEWNFKQDPVSAALVCSTWPTPILFNGEGGSTNSGRRVTYEMPEHNPLTMAYRLYPGVGFAGDRLSWDSISALVTTRGVGTWYEVVGGGTNVTDPATGINVWKEGGDGRHSYLVLKSSKNEVEKVLEDMQTAGQPRPTDLEFNTIYYSDAGMCRVTHSGERNDQSVWQDQAASSWIQYQHVDGRKRLVTSYALECGNKDLLPRAVELTGSNDGGTSWTVLDTQPEPGFSEATPRRVFAVASPAKWNIYRLKLTAANESDGIRVDAIELNERIHSEPGTAVASVSIDQPTLTLPVYGRATLNATPAPRDTFERQVVWSSSDPQTAEVRSVGEQTAMVVGKKQGTCTVTAMIDGVKQVCEVTVAPSRLPAGWSYHELNAPPIPGAASVTEGTFTVTGCGHAMTSWWERVRDQGAYLHRPAVEDFTFAARLRELGPNVGGPAYQWDHRPPTASGLMLRESLTDPLSRYVLIQVEASGQLVARWRDTISQDDNQQQNLGEVELPVHLKLARKGNSIQFFTSTDGQNWGDPRFTHKAPIGDGASVGMFVCSGNTFASTTARFDSVRIED